MTIWGKTPGKAIAIALVFSGESSNDRHINERGFVYTSAITPIVLLDKRPVFSGGPD